MPYIVGTEKALNCEKSTYSVQLCSNNRREKSQIFREAAKSFWAKRKPRAVFSSCSRKRTGWH